MAFKVPEQYRINDELGSKMKQFFRVNPKQIDHWIYENRAIGDAGLGNFMLPSAKTKKGMYLFARASNESGWEHVSISIPSEDRCPTWEEMCFVKDLFWNDPNDVVFQFHPAEKDYISQHDYCLHLWRKIGINFETPPALLVGEKKKKK